MPDHLLFVYGSLRRDAEGRHHPLLLDAAFRGAATTRGKLYRVSWHPGLHLAPNGGVVIGEVFSIPDARHADLMRRLDSYEGPDFRLDPVTAFMADGSAVAASTYVWLGDPVGATFLPDGDFGVPPQHSLS